LLHLEYLDLNYSCQVEKGNMTEMKIHLLYEGCINRAHHRTLAAVRRLAPVRRLALPVLVNVSAGGGQGKGRGHRIPVALAAGRLRIELHLWERRDGQHVCRRSALTAADFCGQGGGQ
jgi:hypothetical protein